jgi:hypothetical protein
VGTAGSLEEKASIVKETGWWDRYIGQVKGAVRNECQQGFHVVMACIKGGPISQVEAQEMPNILKQILTDLEKLQVAQPGIEIELFPSYQKFEQYITDLQPELVDEEYARRQVRERLSVLSNTCNDEGRTFWLSTTKGRDSCRPQDFNYQLKQFLTQKQSLAAIDWDLGVAFDAQVLQEWTNKHHYHSITGTIC